jgi:Bacteriophage baseplate protein W
MSERAPRPIGWPLLPRPDDDGRLRFPTLDESVQQMIKLILRTRPGEQLMHPDFGAGLDQLVHEPNTLDTRRRIRDLVAAGLSRWEPRIVLEDVDVSDVDGAPADVRVRIAYRVRRTGTAGEVGLTMTVGA